MSRRNQSASVQFISTHQHKMGNVNKSTAQRVKITQEDELHKYREALSNKGAGVNIRHQHGQTPLMFAVNEDHVQCVHELIKAGADVNIPDQDG